MTYADGYATLAAANPFRYRGYYWDSETGFYYLQSRYYDPVIGRFISAICEFNSNLIGNNQYAYFVSSHGMFKTSAGFLDAYESVSRGSVSFSTGENKYSETVHEYLKWEQFISIFNSTYVFLDSSLSLPVDMWEVLATFYEFPATNTLTKALSKYSKVMRVVGYTLDFLNIVQTHYKNTTLTSEQKWISLGIDLGYCAITTSASILYGTVVV